MNLLHTHLSEVAGLDQWKRLFDCFWQWIGWEVDRTSWLDSIPPYCGLHYNIDNKSSHRIKLPTMKNSLHFSCSLMVWHLGWQVDFGPILSMHQLLISDFENNNLRYNNILRWMECVGWAPTAGLGPFKYSTAVVTTLVKQVAIYRKYCAWCRPHTETNWLLCEHMRAFCS